MKQTTGLLTRITRLYIDGFKSMTVGRTLWVVIIIKLIVMFGIIRLWLMPDVLGSNYADDHQRAEAVRTTLTTR